MSRRKIWSGVWMDAQKAFIITKENDNDEFEITSQIDCENHDGSRYKSEKIEHSKEILEQKNFFKAISSAITSSDLLYVFGPGVAQEQFKNFLQTYQNFNLIATTLGTSDKITNEEMIAQVKSFYKV